MRLTHEKLEKINDSLPCSPLSIKNRDNDIAIESNTGTFYCYAWQIDNMIKDLQEIKQAIENETGIIF